MPDRRKDSYRFDFDMQVVSVDECGKVTLKLTPNQTRYEWIERNGEKLLYDKFEDFYLAEKLIYEAFDQFLRRQPLYQPQEIDNAENYWTSRIPIIREALSHNSISYEFQDKSEAFLNQLSVEALNFVILSFDVVGSTKLANHMENEKFTSLMQTVLFEISEIVPKFRGYVLKYTGDGLIAYFPEPNFITMNDLALDCALTMRGTIRNAVNCVFKEFSLPLIRSRIGMDSGEAVIAAIGSPEVKQHKDIIGIVVSLAAKIQALARPDEILYGETVERNLHTNWRRHSAVVDLPMSWEYAGADGSIYKVYKCSLP